MSDKKKKIVDIKKSYEPPILKEKDVENKIPTKIEAGLESFSPPIIIGGDDEDDEDDKNK